MQPRHLLSLSDLDRDSLDAILARAASFLDDDRRAQRDGPLAGRVLADLFLEDSTRTRASMDMAAHRLGMGVLDLPLDRSSLNKGESLEDTVRTLAAIGVDLFAVRAREAGTAARVAAAGGVSVINCGEGVSDHPTQGLLDLLTIRQHKGDAAGLSVCIAGDVAHSRVARSACQALTLAGCEDLRVAAPQAWLPHADELGPVRPYTELEPALAGADVVMMLRVQRERLGRDEQLAEADYIAAWQLDAARLGLAAPDAIVMHPGPMNRGVEISDEVADGPRSVIFRQVSNGVAVRMAVICHLLEAQP